jgi:guanyl-specific ribonuclease Sa
MSRFLFTFLAMIGLIASGWQTAGTVIAQKSEDKKDFTLPAGVPAKVAKVLRHIDRTGQAPEGYEGGRRFLNVEKLLPLRDEQGRPLKYREWDVNPLRPGVNRGPERLVTGSNGSAYYTPDHYRSFKRIR